MVLNTPLRLKVVINELRVTVPRCYYLLGPLHEFLGLYLITLCLVIDVFVARDDNSRHKIRVEFNKLALVKKGF